MAVRVLYERLYDRGHRVVTGKGVLRLDNFATDEQLVLASSSRQARRMRWGGALGRRDAVAVEDGGACRTFSRLSRVARRDGRAGCLRGRAARRGRRRKAVHRWKEGKRGCVEGNASFAKVLSPHAHQNFPHPFLGCHFTLSLRNPLLLFPYFSFEGSDFIFKLLLQARHLFDPLFVKESFLDLQAPLHVFYRESHL